LEGNWNGRCEDSYGDTGNLRPRSACKVGMLKPRRPVETHAWSTSCGPEAKSHPPPWKAKFLEWKSTYFFKRAFA